MAEEALSWTSIGILLTFTSELVAKLLVFGHAYFTHSRWEPQPAGVPQLRWSCCATAPAGVFNRIVAC